MHLVQFVEVDITREENRDLFGKYRYEIPVVKLGDRFILRNKQISLAVIAEQLKTFAIIEIK